MWTSLARFWRKLAFQFQRDRFHREMAEELALHAELKQREHAAAGLSAGEAAARARRDMGNLTLALDESHDARSFVSWEHLIQDIRYAVRVLLKSPGFSLVAIGSLALGIAGNTAVFSILNALLIKPLPFGDPDRLVRITEFYPRALLIYFQDRSETMDVASVNPGSEINVTGQGPAFRITASATSANLFSVLRVPAERGRVFEPGEDQKGRSDVVILSHQLWSTRFRSDPDIVGRLIMLDGRPRRIVGVMPASFVFPSRRVQLWLPAALDPADMETYWGRDFVPLIGRLRPGVTLDRAKAEVRALAVGIWTMFPFPMPRNFNANATVISLQRDLAGDSRGRLILLLCAVGIVLVIACANVASLQTARATTRTREMALRAALGAGRFRIVRQLLTESIVLGAAAGAAGLALGASALELFSSVVPPALPGVARIGIDWNVAAFTVALSLVAGISFGLIPALGASRINLADAVKSRTQAAAAASSARLRNLLIAGEIALTLILVVGASLLIRSLYALSTVDPGFNTRRVLAMKISPQSSFCAEPERCIASYEGLLSAVRGLPGIVDAALANTVPLDGSAPALAVDVEDHPKTAEHPAPMFWVGAVTPEYLRVMRIPLVAGRALAASDTRDSEPVVLITQSTARRFWPRQSAIGKHIKVVWEPRWRRVAGVVADVRQHNLANRTPSFLSGAMYMPYAQSVQDDHQIPSGMNVIVQTAADGPKIANELHALAVARNPNVPVGAVVALERQVGESVSDFRSTTWMFLAFAAVALALATIGIYGLVTYSVAQRSYEIGLRMALGASACGIVRMILAQSLRVTAPAIAAGLAGALLVSRLLRAQLFGVASTDPATYLAVPVVLLLVAALASLVPAWRASRADPMRTLRAE